MRKCIRYAALGLALISMTGCFSTSKVQYAYDGAARPVSEVARLIVPSDVEIHGISDTGYKLLDAQKLHRRYEVHLEPGSHTIAARYSTIVPVGFDESETVRSPVRSYEVTLNAGRVYEIKVPEIEDVDGARAYAEAFELTMVSKQAAAPGVTPSTRPALKQAAPSHQESVIEVVPVEQEVAVDRVRPEAPAVQTLDMLEFWWSRATDEERRAFRARFLE